MADNIFVLPETYGPMLRQYYSKLLQEPLPRQLTDLLAMLEEAAAQTQAGRPSDADVGNQAVPQERELDASE